MFYRSCLKSFLYKLVLEGALLFISFKCVSVIVASFFWLCQHVPVLLFRSSRCGNKWSPLWTVGWCCLVWLPFYFSCCILMDGRASHNGVFLTYVLRCRLRCYCSPCGQKCSAWMFFVLCLNHCVMCRLVAVLFRLLQSLCGLWMAISRLILIWRQGMLVVLYSVN